MNSPDTVLDKTDQGDEVAERFNYQHCYAAMNAIRLLIDQSDLVEIICENHEDFLIKKAIGTFIGTQIKTRAPNQPLFKSNDAQIRSALTKFCILDNKFPGCFAAFDFTTNHGFWREADSANNLPWLLNGIRERGGIKGLRSTNPFRQFVDDLAVGAGLKSPDVAATLQKTALRGHESDISSIRWYVREALSECPGVSDLPYLTVVQIAEAVIALARDASMKKLKGSLVDLYAPGIDLAKALEDQQLQGKRISKSDVAALIDQFKHSSNAYQDINLTNQITTADVPSDLVRTVRKLAKGQVEASRVTNIEDLVRSFEALFLQWSRKYGTDVATQRYQNVLAIVQLEATEAHVHAAAAGAPYGSAMYAALFDRLKARSRQDADQLYKCRPEHLVGAVGLLTEQCKTWWSPIFDVNGEVT
jgi:hypothetical protein